MKLLAVYLLSIISGCSPQNKPVSQCVPNPFFPCPPNVPNEQNGGKEISENHKTSDNSSKIVR